jgi:glucose uptake protein GlcU
VIANSTANLANTTANAALPKAGGTMTGNITITAGNTNNYLNTTVYANLWNGTCWVTKGLTGIEYNC